MGIEIVSGVLGMERYRKCVYRLVIIEIGGVEVAALPLVSAAES